MNFLKLYTIQGYGAQIAFIACLRLLRLRTTAVVERLSPEAFEATQWPQTVGRYLTFCPAILEFTEKWREGRNGR